MQAEAPIVLELYITLPLSPKSSAQEQLKRISRLNAGELSG